MFWFASGAGLSALPYWLEKYEIADDGKIMEVKLPPELPPEKELDRLKEGLRRGCEESRVLFLVKGNEKIVQVLNIAESKSGKYHEYLLSSGRKILVVSSPKGKITDLIIFEVGDAAD